jgi:23S rRNA (cytosine1962-C5)-methyltransferase
MIQMLIPSGWEDYELIDSGDGNRLERFGTYTLIRPDPQAIWHPHLPQSTWEKADATFERTAQDKGIWKKSMPDSWVMRYKKLQFLCKLSPFKHTGVFPEQSVHWDFMQQRIQKEKRFVSILNLFGYTGIATLAAAAAGATVTHVDASYPAIGWARENQKLSNLLEKPIRWIEDDAVKFVQREIKRGVKYDGIIMDPPKFGHGPKGERWEFEEMFPNLMKLTTKLLSPNPVFFLVNAYAISASSLMLQNVLADTLTQLSGTISAGELLLQETSSKRVLSTGIYARWEK